ncbi:Alpha/Beta hydrolase protein [Amylostereum chailletii]|nr:Alpha/Beta hydrolase protein [Amylostereum chailletii]
MYARETLVNFRWISRLFAHKSPITLVESDRVPLTLAMELSSLGQFAELAYTTVPLTFVLDNIPALSAPHFPLEGYDAFPGTILIASTRGKVADVQAYVAYRPAKRQLIAAVSGTANLSQTLQDLRFSKHAYHNHAERKGRVHKGFWKMFKGIRPFVLESLKSAQTEYDVDELVLTGHSMGATLSYLIAMEVLTTDNIIPDGMRIKIAAFGPPRAGDEALADYWNELVAAYRAKHGEDALCDWTVKGYNDGVPAIPPTYLGYRHFCRAPLYFCHGKLYHVPPSESEHALFDVASTSIPPDPVLHPRGGHNYYNDRDLEKSFRRMQWLDKVMGKKGVGWEDLYLKSVAKHERDTSRSVSEQPLAGSSVSGASSSSTPSGLP